MAFTMFFRCCAVQKLLWVNLRFPWYGDSRVLLCHSTQCRMGVVHKLDKSLDFKAIHESLPRQKIIEPKLLSGDAVVV